MLKEMQKMFIVMPCCTLYFLASRSLSPMIPFWCCRLPVHVAVKKAPKQEQTPVGDKQKKPTAEKLEAIKVDLKTKNAAKRTCLKAEEWGGSKRYIKEMQRDGQAQDGGRYDV